MERKYETTPKDGMLRIKAIRDFGNVKAGDSGGLITGEENLSHSGTCWVFSSARVSGSARVFGSAEVSKLEHLVTIGPSEFGILTAFRTGMGHLISIGCQQFTLDQIDSVADSWDASPITLAMLPGLKAMLAPLIASWHEASA